MWSLMLQHQTEVLKFLSTITNIKGRWRALRQKCRCTGVITGWVRACKQVFMWADVWLWRGGHLGECIGMACLMNQQGGQSCEGGWTCHTTIHFGGGSTALKPQHHGSHTHKAGDVFMQGRFLWITHNIHKMMSSHGNGQSKCTYCLQQGCTIWYEMWSQLVGIFIVCLYQKMCFLIQTDL